MIAEYDPLYSLLAHPEMPEIESPKVNICSTFLTFYLLKEDLDLQALPEIQFTEYLSFSDIVDQVPSFFDWSMNHLLYRLPAK